MTLKKMLSFGIISVCLLTVHEQVALAEETLNQTQPDITSNQVQAETAETSNAELTPTSEQANKETQEGVVTPELVQSAPVNQPLDASMSETTEQVPDAPEAKSELLAPKQVKFDSLDEIANWQPDQRPDDAINRGSVALVKREKGSPINELASEEAKIQAVPLMNSKSPDATSIGGEEFKAYAFDNWQYLDSMVFWDGPVPTPDVIDASHRNGVPIYGTLFFNWSRTVEDQEKILEFIKEDSDGSNTFPYARKIVDIAKYYGFDGYFINQETDGSMLDDKGETMRQFMLYAQKYAKEQNVPFNLSWYDAMANNGRRNHINGVSTDNDYFVKPDHDGTVPANEFFINFNWNKALNETTAEHMKSLGRNPFDAYAGFELQQRSYNTRIKRGDLIGDDKKLKVSIGLYTPDSILGLSKDGADYHNQENYFWTGPQGDPTKATDQGPWSGMARYVVDKTPITEANFNTFFNTGHGKKWFINGEVSKDGEWNYRSVSEVPPTWKWWVNSDKLALKADYDFDNAYNGGSSLKFTGKLDEQSTNDIMLYASRVPITADTKFKVASQFDQKARLKLGIATKKDYSEESFKYFDIQNTEKWGEQVFNIGETLAGQTAYAIKLRVQNDHAIEDFKANLGQLAIYNLEKAPAKPSDAKVLAKRLHNSQQAEAIIQFKPVENANYYEFYQKIGDKWHIINASSNSTAYLPTLRRNPDASGNNQELRVVAVGKNGVRSEATTFNFDWEMNADDTTLPRPLAPNVTLGAVVTYTNASRNGSEKIENMFTGTITGNSDKWAVNTARAKVDIKLTQTRTVKRWVMEHAGAGGESVADGKMNTRNFDLYYKDENKKWVLAHSVRNNKAHVTDIVLEQPITAQEWRLDVITAHNGTPWGAIRIYNWKMYEELDTESVNLPLSSAQAQILPENKVLIGFNDVKEGVKVSIYRDKEGKELITSTTATKNGPLALSILNQDQLGKLIYYRTTEPGKEESNILALRYQADRKAIKETRVLTQPEKLTYKQGQPLDLQGGQIRVDYSDNKQSQLFNLTHPAIQVLGFNPDKIGEQTLKISFLGKEILGEVKVTVEAFDSSQLTAESVALKEKPKTNYRQGQELDLSQGSLVITFDDQSDMELSLASSSVKITGYDASKVGRQTLTVQYGELTAMFDVIVDEKEPVNTQYLEQELSRTLDVLKEKAYLHASPEKKVRLDQYITDSEASLKNPDITDEIVQTRVKELQRLVQELDGVANFDKAIKTLKDDASGIQITGTNKTLETSHALKVIKLTEPARAKELINGKYDLYDIELVDELNRDTNPTDYVDVSIPVTGRVKKVYYVLDTLAEDLAFTQQDKLVTFKANHFSHYAILYYPSTAQIGGGLPNGNIGQPQKTKPSQLSGNITEANKQEIPQNNAETTETPHVALAYNPNANNKFTYGATSTVSSVTGKNNHLPSTGSKGNKTLTLVGILSFLGLARFTSAKKRRRD